ncbi:MAG: hypothetical protein KC618_03935 [Candidatus Omnitrophica bacterium]|nr:hypothetical protein [Candidatus Omnitrophota bacterium]
MVPIGTSVEKGRATLEKKGFSCRIEKKQRLAVYNLETKQEEIEEVDIVWCDIDDLEPLVQRRYHAFLIFNENDVITKITVQFGVMSLNEKEFKYNKK